MRSSDRIFLRNYTAWTVRVLKVAANKPVTNIDDPRYVKALSHPLRVRILALLQEAGSAFDGRQLLGQQR